MTLYIVPSTSLSRARISEEWTSTSAPSHLMTAALTLTLAWYIAYFHLNKLGVVVGAGAAVAKADKDVVAAVTITSNMAVPSIAEHAFLDAAKNYEFEHVKSLVKSNRRLINVQPGGRWSALHQAAAAGDGSMINWLIAKGARLDLVTRDGKKPIDVAKPSVVDILKQHAFLNAAKNYEFEHVKSLVKSNRRLINVQPGGRWSALHHAAAAGDGSMINWLIARGANLHSQTRDGKKPIDVAMPSVVGILQAEMVAKQAQGQAGQAKALAVVFPLSRSGRRVFMAKRPNGQYMTFGGKRDLGGELWYDGQGAAEHADYLMRQTASREFRDEGGDVPGGVLDLTGWTERMVEDHHGSTTYFIGRAPKGTTWKDTQKNKETTGGVWLSLDDLKALHAAGQLRFGHHVLNIAKQVMTCGPPIIPPPIIPAGAAGFGAGAAGFGAGAAGFGAVAAGFGAGAAGFGAGAAGPPMPPPPIIPPPMAPPAFIPMSLPYYLL